MVKPVKRRQASTIMVQQLWEGIRTIKHHKQVPNMERLARYMEREYDTRPSETANQLHFAVMDELVKSYKAVGKKGSRVGVEQEGFKLPETDDMQKDGHDWYCFNCHKTGEVLLCDNCWRVFHPSCTEEDYSGVRFVCAICKEDEAGRKRSKLKRKELNQLLSFTALRLKEKTRELHRMGTKEDEEKFELLLYSPMDLSRMEDKVQQQDYNFVEEFQADAENVLHNVVLCYGEYHGMSDLARIMVKDCIYDLEEVKRCSDCYKMSNLKPKDWFCRPCNPPHDIVWAKQKGYSYWPAKVIRVVDNNYDVRFFGAFHQRATLPETSIKPIEVSVSTLGIKKTPGFVKSCHELERYQKILEKFKKDYPNGPPEEESDIEDPPYLNLEDVMVTTKKRKGDKRRKKEKVKKKKKEKEKKARRKRKAEVDAADEEEEEAGDISEEEEEDEEYEPPRKATKREKKTPGRKGKRKKVDDVDVSSSNADLEEVETPEDANLVTSSEDKVPPVSSSLIKKQTAGSKSPVKGTQTESEVTPSNGCNCEEKYAKIMKDTRDQLEKKHKEEKERVKKDLSEKMQKEFEEDKQQAVSRAVANNQREIERVRKQTEEKCREQYMEEMKKLAQKHKEAISAVKKKQWCYNCEEEAMYHCCWNTSYCSIKCQQEHWHKEHKKVCRRKR
ncbi:zinc finger MYND domain-containing protein 11 [Lingula anatina]|uniref:Zinc finger MYND domain-containing protein 11 n=1 Tax=Lingula anatina TaxID=7574 RepID=A0A2R2MLD9_LINAN|nr:zinc finger MYND domain-containing protein 11 [Lingula anatina]|eukprot:XP_023931028.1 zinc finger MYND domain-containing protein 11 [Lingula anatina]